MTTLKQLEKERAKLLATKKKQMDKRAIYNEKRRLKGEIFDLKNPFIAKTRDKILPALVKASEGIANDFKKQYKK